MSEKQLGTSALGVHQFQKEKEFVLTTEDILKKQL